MAKIYLPLCAAFALVACGTAGDTPANQTTASAEGGEAGNAVAEAPKPKKTGYCFFKDSETSGWSASRDQQGNVVVKGRAFRSDPRYKAALGAAEINGSIATISPTISQNDGYASPGNWWDVTATIPDSATVETVKVECGAKTLAELGLRRPG